MSNELTKTYQTFNFQQQPTFLFISHSAKSTLHAAKLDYIIFLTILSNDATQGGCFFEWTDLDFRNRVPFQKGFYQNQVISTVRYERTNERTETLIKGHLLRADQLKP